MHTRNLRVQEKQVIKKTSWLEKICKKDGLRFPEATQKIVNVIFRC